MFVFNGKHTPRRARDCVSRCVRVLALSLVFVCSHVLMRYGSGKHRQKYVRCAAHTHRALHAAFAHSSSNIVRTTRPSTATFQIRELKQKILEFEQPENIYILSHTVADPMVAHAAAALGSVCMRVRHIFTHSAQCNCLCICFGHVCAYHTVALLVQLLRSVVGVYVCAVHTSMRQR